MALFPKFYDALRAFFRMPMKKTIAALRVESVVGAQAVVVTQGTKPRPGSKLTRWELSWGDGTPPVTGKGSPMPRLEHVYAVSGNFGVALNVYDSLGGSAQASVSVSASVPAPDPIPDPITEPEPIPEPEPTPDPTPDPIPDPTPPPTGSTITAMSLSRDHIQLAVDMAVDEQTVVVPAGQATWTDGEPVVIINKNIHIRGAGAGQSVITRDGNFVFYVVMTAADRGNWRISGFTFQGNTQGAVIESRSMSYRGIPDGRWRVDHNDFNYTVGQRTGVQVSGVNYGVFDHNIVTWPTGAVVLFHGQLDSEGTASNEVYGDWLNRQPVDYGTDKFVFMEDNVFTPAGNNALNVYDASGGGRVVYRHNHATGAFFYNHWTRGFEMAGHVHEIYDNVWVGTAAYGIATGMGYPIRLEGGTAVIYRNTAIGFHREGENTPYVFLDDRRADGSEAASPLLTCDGSRPWDGNIESNGWPCLGQIGRGTGVSYADLLAGAQQPSEPVYLWDNVADTGVPWGVYARPASHVKATPHSNGEVDYVEGTPRPGYTPYPYPHPLTQAA